MTEKPYWVYILRLKDGRLYTGLTSDLKRRLKEHKYGVATRTTRVFGFDELIYSEKFPDRKSAGKREREIKGWKKEKKIALSKAKSNRSKS